MRTPHRLFVIPLVLAATTLASTLLIPTSASAQAVCGSRDSLLKQLHGSYKEAPISMALAANGSVVEVTRSDAGTWTLLLTDPKGVTCLMAAGEHWENLKQKKAGFKPS